MRMMALLSLAFICTAQAKPDILYELERDGYIVWQGKCTFISQQYHCIMVLHRDEEYLIAGYLREDGLDVRHVMRGGKEPTVIWSYSWVRI